MMSATLAARRVAVVIAGVALLSATAGCSRLRTQQGHILDATLVDGVKAGVDNRDSVAATLGRPSFTGQFGDSDWYYLSRVTRQLAFADPKPASQALLHVRFDPAGNVVEVKKSGLETIASISPNGDKTPTLGRQQSFFEDIFGNIGSVGAPGAAGAGSGQSNDPTQP